MAPLVEYLQERILPEDEAYARKLKRQAVWASCPFVQWGMDIVGPFPTGPGQKKFLLMAVDYLSKWVEAEPLARITEEAVLGFIGRTLSADSAYPGSSSRTMGDPSLWCWYELGGGGPGVLWSCRTTPRTATGETPFSLVYGSEAVIPVEIGQISLPVKAYQEGGTMDRTQELDLIEEKRERAAIHMEAYRSRIIKAFNQKIKPWDFQIGDLVLKKVNPAGEVKKLEAKWEGPYKIIRRVGRNAWYLEDNRGKVLQRPWNTMHLKSYYS
ncbi:uncharacterized protein [Henckelia pumila]|uniref:uncharacterized protein n=1 Tax=Henckelia pumila TaxID=405737 RepID=UPI003C6E27D6